MNTHVPPNPGADIHALSGAYAVDALDDLERALFEAHLAQCEACREEVAGFGEVTSLLGSAAASGEITVPEQLRGRVLKSIGTVRPLPPLVEPEQAPTSDAATPATPTTSTTPATVVPFRPRRRRRMLLAAAAALVVIGGGATVVAQPWADETSQTDQLALANLVVADPDARKVTLGFPDGAKATAFMSPAQERVALVTSAMPSAPKGKDYQLWLGGEDGVLRPAGLMPDKPNQTLLFDGDTTGVTVAAISVEPTGGSASPTGKVIAEFEFEGTA